MKIKSSIALIAALALSTTAALATTFATNATIAAGNTTYDGQPIIVSNCTLTVNGPHSFASLQVISNAVLTHSAAPNGEASNLLSLTIAGNLGVDSSSEIDVSGLGTPRVPGLAQAHIGPVGITPIAAAAPGTVERAALPSWVASAVACMTPC